jgi:hypothetical protein
MYKFRNLPLTIKPAREIWAISGTFYPDLPNKKIYETGILEWCYDEEDAKQLLEFMENYDGFENLFAFKYQNEEQINEWARFYVDSQILGEI